MTDVPAIRIALANDASVRRAGRYVLYWMIASRRARHNFGLDRAIELARDLDRPLVVLEALRCDYPWASDRLHRFVIDGMADNASRFSTTNVLYHPYVEPALGAGKGLLAALAADACAVITDDFPCFFLPHMVGAAAKKLPVRLEAVDSNGLLPMRASPKAFLTARSFRAFVQQRLVEHLRVRPAVEPAPRVDLPVLKSLPKALMSRWPAASDALLSGDSSALAKLPIDHSVRPSFIRGGALQAQRALKTFVQSALDRYPDHRNQPEIEGTSRLSPYLHFGHIGAHEILAAILRHEGVSPGALALKRAGGSRASWGLSEASEAFLDQLVTWRELGFNMCAHRPDYDRYESLPAWARRTLAEHASDPRPATYPLAELERAATHDPLWNAAQMQLVRDGWQHNYMRMLWGKKILEWSATPELALEAMVNLMNKYSLDGRNPNSYSGYFWVLGRYDRPWGPERPIFGNVRYMSSASTAKKLRVRKYIEKYVP